MQPLFHAAAARQALEDPAILKKLCELTRARVASQQDAAVSGDIQHLSAPTVDDDAVAVRRPMRLELHARDREGRLGAGQG